MKIQHKGLGIDIDMPEILQGKLEEFERETEAAISYVNEHGLQVAIFNGSLLRAAVKVGWLPGIEIDEIPNMPPAKVAFIASQITQALIDARDVPPQ